MAEEGKTFGGPAVSARQVNVLVIGSGGREHALCWRLRQSAICGHLYCAPGNAGVVHEAGVQPVPSDLLNVSDHDAVILFCARSRIGLVVIGPEAPLVAGLGDALRAAGVLVFGPNANAAQLEGSKVYMKDLCARHGIPTAGYATFTDAAAAEAHIRAVGAPVVVKADGLAAGKGVVVARTVQEAVDAVHSMMTQRAFGDAGAKLVVEDFLTGEEASFFVLVGTDGECVPLAACQDHKAVGDGDTGPNTGGMGAYCPAPVVTPEHVQVVMDTCVKPTVAAMAAEGTPFSGVLFAGLMIDGPDVKLLEYNVRFGDPECQALMVRMTGDLVALLLGCASGRTLEAAAQHLHWGGDASCCVVMAAKGYPGVFAKGEPIGGLRQATATGAVVFHAGTTHDYKTDTILSNGGRVLCVTGVGASVKEAAAAAYKGVDAINWPGGFCRRDIGWRAIAREEAGQ